LDEILLHQVNKQLESYDPCYSQLLLLAERKKTPLFSDFKNPCKKNKKRLKRKGSSLCLATLTNKADQEFHLRIEKFLLTYTRRCLAKSSLCFRMAAGLSDQMETAFSGLNSEAYSFDTDFK
jgi:hypothetical protein